MVINESRISSDSVEGLRILQSMTMDNCYHIPEWEQCSNGLKNKIKQKRYDLVREKDLEDIHEVGITEKDYKNKHSLKRLSGLKKLQAKAITLKEYNWVENLIDDHIAKVKRKQELDEIQKKKLEAEQEHKKYLGSLTTVSKIANNLGKSESTIRRLIRKIGYPIEHIDTYTIGTHSYRKDVTAYYYDKKIINRLKRLISKEKK